MKESQLQLYWLNHVKELTSLKTVNGERINIVYGGDINFNQGPDFLHARIEINDALWIGSVEIHINSSEWFQHQHEHDVFYKNVILHVVWKHDLSVFEQCPTLELSSILSQLSFFQINLFAINPVIGRCISLPAIEYLETLGLERLEKKSHAILLDVKLHKGDWNFIFWKRMMYAFGLPLNAYSFEQIFISIKPLLHHSGLFNAYNLKCLLIGQAGLFELLEQDEINQYRHLKNTMHIKDCHTMLMKFRMRPLNFPEKRILEFLEIFIHYNGLMHSVIEEKNLEDPFFENIKKEFGSGLFNRIVINVFTPFLIAFDMCNESMLYRKKAIRWIQSLDPEDNMLTRRYTSTKQGNLNALHSQGMIANALNNSS
jgi:hypothetical protein